MFVLASSSRVYEIVGLPLEIQIFMRFLFSSAWFFLVAFARSEDSVVREHIVYRESSISPLPSQTSCECAENIEGAVCMQEPTAEKKAVAFHVYEKQLASGGTKWHLLLGKADALAAWEHCDEGLCQRIRRTDEELLR